MMQLLSAIVGFFLPTIPTAFAQFSYVQYCQTLHPGCGAGSAFIIQLAARVIDIVSEVMGVASVVFFLWGAFKMVTSGGNDEGRTEGKNIMIASLIGVALAVLGEGIVMFAANFAASWQ